MCRTVRRIDSDAVIVSPPSSLRGVEHTMFESITPHSEMRFSIRDDTLFRLVQFPV